MTDLKYSESHEWVSIDGDLATVGISDHAQDMLGDVVFVELPEVGAEVSAKQEVAVVESVKAASDIYSPVSGEIIEVNQQLLEAPDLINSSPEESGWLFKLKISDPSELDVLLDSAAYAEHCG